MPSPLRRMDGLDANTTNKRTRVLEEEAVKRIRWSEELLSRRPLSPRPTCADNDPHTRHFSRALVVEEEITPPRMKPDAPENSTAAVPPSLGRSSSILTAAAALLDASRESCAAEEADNESTRRRLQMRTGAADQVAQATPARRLKKKQRAVASLSGATRQQLTLLAGAFQLRPRPS